MLPNDNPVLRIQAAEENNFEKEIIQNWESPEPKRKLDREFWKVGNEIHEDPRLRYHFGSLKSIERPRLGENQLYYLEKCWQRFPLNTGIIQMKHEISLKKLGINSRWELNKDVESYNKRMSKFDWDLIEGGAKSNLRVVLPRKRAQARSQDAWRKASTCDSGQNRSSP